MEQIIEIDLNNKYDFIDKYNEKKLSNEVIEYIVKQAISKKKNRKIKIVINKKCRIDKDITKSIKERLKEEYNCSLKERDRNNIKQLIFFLLGLIFIFLSTLIASIEIISVLLSLSKCPSDLILKIT